MTATVSETSNQQRGQRDDSIGLALNQIEEVLGRISDHLFDSDYFDELGREFRRLHARMRIHHAVGFVYTDDECGMSVPPELQAEVDRLRAEHPRIIGQLDRLIRDADSMADRTLEDKDVFGLRAREMIACLRRHEAEEDRLFYLSVWRVTGGES